jgi:hypothetical protein
MMGQCGLSVGQYLDWVSAFCWRGHVREVTGFVWGWGDRLGMMRCWGRQTIITIAGLFPPWFARCHSDRHLHQHIWSGMDADMNFRVVYMALQNMAPLGSPQCYL